MIRRRRSIRSPSAPAGIPSSNTGRLPAAEIAPIRTAELVSDSINHCAATVCIHEPTLLTNCADQSRLNAGVRNGLQPETAGTGGVKRPALAWRAARRGLRATR